MELGFVLEALRKYYPPLMPLNDGVPRISPIRIHVTHGSGSTRPYAEPPQRAVEIWQLLEQVPTLHGFWILVFVINDLGLWIVELIKNVVRLPCEHGLGYIPPARIVIVVLVVQSFLAPDPRSPNGPIAESRGKISWQPLLLLHSRPVLSTPHQHHRPPGQLVLEEKLLPRDVARDPLQRVDFDHLLHRRYVLPFAARAIRVGRDPAIVPQLVRDFNAPLAGGIVDHICPPFVKHRRYELPHLRHERDFRGTVQVRQRSDGIRECHAIRKERFANIFRLRDRHVLPHLDDLLPRWRDPHLSPMVRKVLLARFVRLGRPVWTDEGVAVQPASVGDGSFRVD
mmetsp:Transcript_7909/g.23397  ORF Transcript_7909/g.23397 Transcript_7909/m.23397 type:complete len:340 (+) Transcript_7909:1192-2211(+)